MWTIIFMAACSESEPPNTAAVNTTEAVTTTIESDSENNENVDSEGVSATESRLDNLELDEWEDNLLADIVEATRIGVQLYGDQGFGLCAPDDRNRCGEDAQYLGREHGVLPHGDFIVKADLQAPAYGEDWQVEYERNCTLADSDDENAQPSRSRPWRRIVRYKENRAYPQRFPAVQSPSRDGTQECVIRLFSLRPDDDTRTLIAEGQFTIPGLEDEAPDYNEYLASFARQQADESDGDIASEESDGETASEAGEQP